MIIISVIVGAVSLFVIVKVEPEGPAAALLWTIFLSCIGNIIFVLLFGDMSTMFAPSHKQSSSPAAATQITPDMANIINAARNPGELPAELK